MNQRDLSCWGIRTFPVLGLQTSGVAEQAQPCELKALKAPVPKALNKAHTDSPIGAFLVSGLKTWLVAEQKHSHVN